MTLVILNKRPIGETDKPLQLLKEIIEKRRKGVISKEVNVSYDKVYDILEINTDRGRLRRPLIVVKDGKPLLTEKHLRDLQAGKIKWEDLVESGIIEYLDADEEKNAYIALSPDELTKEHTHLEIHPCVILGMAMNLAPFPEFNQAPKTFDGGRMCEQGVGVYCLNFHLKMDTDVSLGWYPQLPIVKTVGFDAFPKESTAIGQNVIVAIIEYEGYNMQDAIIMNKASIERGLFRAYYFRPYETEETIYTGGMKDRIEIPPEDIYGYRGAQAYENLEEDGIIYPEAEVKGGDVLIGKVSPPRFFVGLEKVSLGAVSNRDSSVEVRREEEGTVDSVIITETKEGNKLVKVRLRRLLIPEIGDKFATRQGQKGVIGLIVPQENMPFTASGIIPDVLFSPHSIPSRMTIGYLLELLAGKVGSLIGKFVDGTPFDSINPEELKQILLDLGFRDSGEETMYDGITGERYKVRIMVGNMYYLRLRHHVVNKMHARARGPVALLTRQPTEGKAREGGLRIGEMEKDVLVAHGASLVLRERWSSDSVKIPVCEKCGLIGYYDKYKGKKVCPIHGDSYPLKYIEVSYAFKLFLDELLSMGIYPRLYIKPKIGEEK